MPRKNRRDNASRAPQAPRRSGPGSPRPGALAWIDGLDPFGDELPEGVSQSVAPALNVILTEHARRQLGTLGPEAEMVVLHLRELGRHDLMWMAEQLPSQHGRDVWMLWAGPVRVLFDVEDDDLTVQGFGLRPRF